MSEQLRQAVERARLERRSRLLAEVSAFLEPGERVLELTGGKLAAEGMGEDGSSVRLMATDRRLLVLRKKAFRQYAVEEFAYDTAEISLGYTAESGGRVELSDLGRRMLIRSVPEPDLAPFFHACSVRLNPDRLSISLEGETAAAADEPGAREFEPSESAKPEPLLNAEPALAPENPSPREAAGHAQAAILRWLVSETRAAAGVCLEESTGRPERLLVEPRRLDAETVMDLVRRARGGGEIPSPGVVSMRWAGQGGSKVLLLSGVPEEAALDKVGFARFVIDWLESSALTGPAGPTLPAGQPTALQHVPQESARPILLNVELTSEPGGKPAAEVQISWQGKRASGRALGHTSTLGRYLATARAAADALQRLAGIELLVEHLYVTFLPMDAELVVVVVLMDAMRCVGATAARRGTEDWGGARALLDAVNRSLTHRSNKATGDSRRGPERASQVRQ